MSRTAAASGLSILRLVWRLVERWCPRVRPSRTLPEEVMSAYSYMPATLAGHLAGIAVVTFLYWRLVPWAVLVPWLGIFAVMWGTRLTMKLRFKHVVMDSTDDWLRWRLYWNLGSLSAGALWGLTGWVFYPLGGGIQQTGLIVIVYTFSVVVVPVLATQPRMYLAFVGLCFLP
ncbi:MAG: hypothetical protein V4739_04770, partial [Pseudomonadota bacterium]